MQSFRLIAGAVLLAACGAGLAADFKSVGAAPAILYDAPSARGSKLYLAPRGMPLEVLLSYGEWVKVRDMNGDLAWTEARMLSPRRLVVVKAASARLRAEANEAAPLLMTAERGVLLELIDPRVSTWVRVRHRDGIIGFVNAADIWGI